MTALKEELEGLRAGTDSQKCCEAVSSEVVTEDCDAGWRVERDETAASIEAEMEQYRAGAESARIDIERLCGEDENLRSQLVQSRDEVQSLKQKLEDALAELEMMKLKPHETEVMAADIEDNDADDVTVNCESAKLIDAANKTLSCMPAAESPNKAMSSVPAAESPNKAMSSVPATEALLHSGVVHSHILALHHQFSNL